MTALNLYFSTNTPDPDRPYVIATADSTGGSSGSLNMGYKVGTTSTRAADFFELRIMLYSTGTTSTNVTKKDVEMFLECAKRWLHDQTSGLDSVIQSAITEASVATAATAHLP